MLGELRSCSALYPHLSSVPFHSRLPGLGGESGMAQDEPSWKMDTERSRITSLEAPSSWRGTEIGISWVLLHENLPPRPRQVHGSWHYAFFAACESMEQLDYSAELDGALCISPGLAHVSVGWLVGQQAGP